MAHNVMSAISLLNEVSEQLDDDILRSKVNSAISELEGFSAHQRIIGSDSTSSSLTLLLNAILDLLLPSGAYSLKLTDTSEKYLKWNILVDEEFVAVVLGDRGKVLRSIEYVMNAITDRKDIKVTVTLNE